MGSEPIHNLCSIQLGTLGALCMLDSSGIEVLRSEFIKNASTWRLLFFILLAVCGTLVRARAGFGLPKDFRLRKKGLDLLLAGKPVEAEKCYREALSLGSKVSNSDKVRLLVCLGDALTDQGRYKEAEECVAGALQMGDPSGSGQGSMADILLLEKKEPEKAVDCADEALRLISSPVNRHFGSAWSAVQDDLYEAKTWGRKAQAFALLGQRVEAKQAVERAIRIVEGSKDALARTMPQTNPLAMIILGNRRQRMKTLFISATHWQIGQALLALGDTTKAAEHFQIVRDTDQMGKYRNLANQELIRLGAWAG